MRRLLLLLATAAIVLAIAWWLANLPGQVVLQMAGFTIETRAGLAVLGAAILLTLVIVVLRLLLAVLNLPARLLAWRARRRRAKGEAAITMALVGLAAAQPQAARAAAAQARTALGDTPQTLLFAAEANRLAGRDAEASAIYRQMESLDGAAFLGLRGLFRQALAREDWTEAAALARRAETAHPGGAWLRDERLALAARIGDWEQAQALAETPPLRLAFATAAAQSTTDPDRALTLARRAWKQDRGFAPAALAYAAALRDGGKESRAQSVLAEAWTELPHPALAELALAPLHDPMARVAAATRLVAGAAGHLESHFLLACATLGAGLTGEARRHAAAARAGGLAQKRLFLLLAELEAAEHGNTPASQQAQRDVLREAATAEPDPAWHCDTCGAAQQTWRPACPSCHAAGRLRWASAPRLMLAAT